MVTGTKPPGKLNLLMPHLLALNHQVSLQFIYATFTGPRPPHKLTIIYAAFTGTKLPGKLTTYLCHIYWH